MLYLFNSGYRSKYVQNVLNTLFLPFGMTNQYRYRYRAPTGSSAATHISPESLAHMQAITQGTAAIVVFVDRFTSGGYTYHPLRMARYIKSHEENDYLFFTVQMDDYIYPRDIHSFNEMFRSNMHAKQIPQLRDNDPYNPYDGLYALSEQSLFSQHGDFYKGENAWTACVQHLRDCAVFRGTTPPLKGVTESQSHKPIDYIFMHCALTYSSGKALCAKLKNGRAVFYLVRGKEYELRCSYQYPRQLTNTAAMAVFSPAVGTNLKRLGAPDINIDSHMNSVSFYFTTKRCLEETFDSISFAFRSTEEGRDVAGPDCDMSVHIHESKAFWAQIVIALLFFSALGVYLGADVSKIWPLSLSTLFTALWDKALVGLGQAAVLFWLFRLVGKKFL